MRNRVAVMHGVNLSALERRPAEHYGGLTFTVLEQKIARFARELELTTHFFDTNHEGEFVEELHKASGYTDGLLLNPGAWTHYSWAIRDALEISGLPVRLDPDVDLEQVMEATRRDKKRRGGRVGFVLVEGPGDVRTGCPVADDDLRAAVAELV